MELRLHDSADEFRALAEPIYRRDPVAYTIELTLLRSSALPDDSLFVTIWDSSHLVGAALQTPPYPLACNSIPLEAVDIVAAELAQLRPALDGVRGTDDTAVAFARAWQAATGREWHVTVQERLYRLGSLRTPHDVVGTARGAAGHDRDQLVEWVGLFFEETFGHPRNKPSGPQFLDAADRKQDRFILWIVGGVPVSMAMLRAAAAGVSRIGPVFTPVGHRGRGYGSAVTAAAARRALRNGADDVVLFADLANPVSNSIYRRIGFEPLADSVHIEFGTLD